MVKHIKELPVSELEFQMFVLDEIADELQAGNKDVIKLTIGISELEIPEKVLQVFADTIFDYQKTHRVYPQGIPELRQAIADYYNQQYHISTQAENVIVNVGTSSIFRNLFQILCQPGQEILLPKPYYCLYSLSGILAGAKISYYEIDYQKNQINFDSFRSAYDPDKTAVVVLNNPGNPLGNVLTKDEIIEINQIVAGRSFIINDEIYNNTLFYTEYESPLSYLDEFRDVNIVTNAFSKGFRMYTKRVGYAILPDSLIMPMRIVQQHTLLTHDPVNQYGAIAALQDLEAPKELTRIYKSRAEYSYTQLEDTGCDPIKAEGGFYIVLDCDRWVKEKGMEDSKELAVDIARKVHVATVPGTDFGIPNCLRLSFCNDRYNEGIDRLRDYFTS
ncbi:pyridoxal phosphate-dependent aminotransferase [Lyngbya sp. PCC 8106]|uniref:pyridoxal phosphate-dependent aminotransferase n=1 Tax=Lyngbya sp. (strain PCC 8106) TaxID=313612 RepID=UPI0000EA89AD|nr:aminotransferase class I/II-fold pyridoxal phosphate-dependent enzyme [Lyngbya sp. PCC 8106]EAW37236.1 aspartate aminotransferase [Lyngbya sp. PCC 8106]